MPFLQYTLTLISESSWILLTLLFYKATYFQRGKEKPDKIIYCEGEETFTCITENI